MVVLRVALRAALAACTLWAERAGGSEATRPTPSPARLVVPPGVTQLFAGPAAAPQMVTQYDPGAPLDVIVRFSAPPLGRVARSATEVSAARAPYQRFRADLATLEAAAPGLAHAVVKRR